MKLDPIPEQNPAAVAVLAQSWYKAMQMLLSCFERRTMYSSALAL